MELLSGKGSSNIDTVDGFKPNLEGSLKDVRFSHQLAKARQTAESSLKYTMPSYKAG